MIPTSSTGREALLANPFAGTPQDDPNKAASVSAGERSLAQLQQTQRVAADTERLGMTIMGQLADQRGQLVDAIDRREEAHQQLSTSSRLISQMSRRASWIKLGLCLIVLGLIGGIIGVVYMQFGDKGSSPTTPPGGRRLQDSSLLPPSPPPPPPSPPVTLAPPSNALGAGVIALLVLGIIFVAVCAWAYPRGLAMRSLVCVGLSLLYAIITIILVFLPREPSPAAQMAEAKIEITDSSSIGRVALFICSVLGCCSGLICLLVCHALVPQRAPQLKEVLKEDVEAFRIKE